jgi:prepilin-type N-terminal cleavage/methylation domain-containing protein
MRKSHGFTLIEIVVVLAIVALLLSMATFATRAITIQQRISATVTRLATVDAALIQFVMVQKRLPCPADGTKASGDAAAGVEMWSGGVCTTQANGVVPWMTLGISENDATDGWLRRLTYRVDPSLVANSGMDMSLCDPASTAPSPVVAPVCAACSASSLATCTPPQNFLLGKGLPIQNVAGAVVMQPTPPLGSAPTGAAYVLISHGESGGGGFLNSGVQATTTTTDGTEEQKNYANLGYIPGASYYVDDSIADIAGVSHFDDMLSHPTVIAVVNKAALGPRSH